MALHLIVVRLIFYFFEKVSVFLGETERERFIVFIIIQKAKRQLEHYLHDLITTVDLSIEMRNLDTKYVI